MSILGDSFAQLGCDDRDEEDREGAARAAQLVGGCADRDQGEEDQGRCLQGIADGDRHGGAAHGRCIGADVNEPLNAQLCAQGIEDRADEEGREQTLRHGAERVDPVAFRRDHNVLAGEEALLVLFHFVSFPFPF